MKPRTVRIVTLLVGLSVLVSGGSALAGVSGTDVPLATVRWSLGNPSTVPATRFDGQYDAATNRVYFLGFRTSGDVTDGSVWYYDVAAGTYTDTGVDMPVPVSNYGIVPLSDSQGLGFYLFGGRDANAVLVTTVQAYYPALNQAFVISSDPWPGETPSGCVALPAMGAIGFGNTAIVMGGVSFLANGCLDEQSDETWVFDPTAPNGSKWSAGPALNLARGYITPAAIGGRVFAIGGDTNSAGTLIPQTIVEAWQVGVGGWDDAVADLPEACDESQAFAFTKGALTRSILLTGCGQWPNAVPDVLQWKERSNSWAIIGTLIENRRNHAGALLPGGRSPIIYILGGYGEASQFIDPLSSSELGKPTRGGAPVGGGAPGHASSAATVS
jgi:hypothetical protein